MVRNNIKKAAIPLLAVCMVFIFTPGCSKVKKDTGKEVVARVNKDVIYKDDLKRELALQAKIDPNFKVTPDIERELLDSIIERKLIVQYAMEKGLARDENFVNAIRLMWEHTLIRNFVDYKKRELQDYLFATSEDIKKYYDNMSNKATFKAFRSKDKKAVNEAYQKYLKDKDTSGWMALGPANYEDIASVVLMKAFDMNKGDAGIFEDAHNYYVIELTDKEKIEIAPLDSLKPEIEKRVIALKERILFEDWISQRRKNSNIKINEGFLNQ